MAKVLLETLPDLQLNPLSNALKGKYDAPLVRAAKNTAETSTNAKVKDAAAAFVKEAQEARAK